VGNLADQLNNIGTTPPTQNLTHQDTAGGVRATRVEGEHDNRDHERILVACGHDPSRVRFAAPPAVYVKLDELSERVYTTYRYKLEEVVEDFSATAMDRWRDSLKAPLHLTAESLDNTYVIAIADPQLGKKGTAEAVENWKRGVAGHIQTIRDLQALGRSPEQVHVAWMGDEVEGVCNNYGNQPHTIELNQSQQLELDFDLRVWTLKQVAELGLTISASSVISNHGEWTRNGGKDVVTTRNDNASTFIARQTKKLFAEAESFGGPKIAWTIGDTRPGLVVNLSGEDCYFSHGYVEKGRGGSTELRTKSAIDKQILGNITEYGHIRPWVFAHYHHLYTNEFEGRTLFGCPALEAEKSSEYMLEQFGVWSPAGMLGMQVGSKYVDRGWSHLNVF